MSHNCTIVSSVSSGPEFEGNYYHAKICYYVRENKRRPQYIVCGRIYIVCGRTVYLIEYI